MLFTSKIVESNLAGVTMIRIAIVSAVFISITLVVPAFSELTPFILGGMILSVIVAAIVYKGDLSSYKMEKNMFVFDEEMQIDNFVFPFEELSKLKFTMGSYSTLNSLGDSDNKNNDYGMDNEVFFHYKSQDFKYQFFLRNKKHFHQFIDMLQCLYDNRIRFEEQNLKGKTYLMRNVDEEQYSLLTKRYRV